jgi:hypothetical protein
MHRESHALDRAGRGLRASGWPLLAIAALLAIPGFALMLSGHGWQFGVGAALAALALGPTLVGVGLLVSWRAAREKPFVWFDQR